MEARKYKSEINIKRHKIYFSTQLTEASFLEVLEKLLSTLLTEVVDLKDDFDEMRKLGFKKSCVSYLALYIKKGLLYRKHWWHYRVWNGTVSRPYKFCPIFHRWVWFGFWVIFWKKSLINWICIWVSTNLNHGVDITIRPIIQSYRQNLIENRRKHEMSKESKDELWQTTYHMNTERLMSLKVHSDICTLQWKEM